MTLIVIIILLLILAGTVPLWPHSRSWGYRPTGWIIGALIIVLILVYMGVI